MADTATITRGPEPTDTDQPSTTDSTAGRRTDYDAGRRRFVIAVVVGAAARPSADAVAALGPLERLGQSASCRPLRQLLRPAGPCHLPRPPLPPPQQGGDRGLRPRRPPVHLLRSVPLHHPHARPPRDEQARRTAHGAVDPRGLAVDRRDERPFVLAAPRSDEGSRSSEPGRGGLLRRPDGVGDGRLGHHLPCRHTLHLQRGLRLEHPPHPRLPPRPRRDGGTAHMGPLGGSLCLRRLRQPQPHPLGLCLRDRGRSSGRLVRAGQTGSREPSVGGAPRMPWGSSPFSSAVR